MEKNEPEEPDKASLYQGEISCERYESGGGYCNRSRKHTSCAKDRFAGKVAVITGAAGNFGAACAERLAQEGAILALYDLRSAEFVRSGLKNAEQHLIEVIDLTQYASVEEAIQRTVRAFGRIDYCFNNAGYQGNFSPTIDYDPDDFAKVLQVNVNGVFHVLKAVANAMKLQSPQGGVIVNTASMAAHSAPPNMPAYAASKAAVLHLTKASAKDLAPYSIRVNSISPAFIGPGVLWTRQIELQALAHSQYYDKDPSLVARQMIESTPMRRYGTIDEVIGPALFLFSDDASYLTGVDIQITGGMN